MSRINQYIALEEQKRVEREQRAEEAHRAAEAAATQQRIADEAARAADEAARAAGEAAKAAGEAAKAAFSIVASIDTLNARISTVVHDALGDGVVQALIEDYKMFAPAMLHEARDAPCLADLTYEVSARYFAGKIHKCDPFYLRVSSETLDIMYVCLLLYILLELFGSVCGAHAVICLYHCIERVSLPSPDFRPSRDDA
jgi:hypothetical protein